jgi:hypothetical protein
MEGEQKGGGPREEAEVEQQADWRDKDAVGVWSWYPWTGAGVLPFAFLTPDQATTEQRGGASTSSGSGAGTEQERRAFVLFHRKTKGKKAGYLVDFGGGREDKDEGRPLFNAARELNEETGGILFLSTDDLAEAKRQGIFESDELMQKSPLVAKATLSLLHRITGSSVIIPVKSKGDEAKVGATQALRPVWHMQGWTYQLFGLEVSYISSRELNGVFASSKRGCTFEWVPAEEVIGSRASELYPRLNFLTLGGVINQVIKLAKEDTA